MCHVRAAKLFAQLFAKLLADSDGNRRRWLFLNDVHVDVMRCDAGKEAVVHHIREWPRQHSRLRTTDADNVQVTVTSNA